MLVPEIAMRSLGANNSTFADFDTYLFGVIIKLCVCTCCGHEHNKCQAWDGIFVSLSLSKMSLALLFYEVEFHSQLSGVTEKEESSS